MSQDVTSATESNANQDTIMNKPDLVIAAPPIMKKIKSLAPSLQSSFASSSLPSESPSSSQSLQIIPVISQTHDWSYRTIPEQRKIRNEASVLSLPVAPQSQSFSEKSGMGANTIDLKYLELPISVQQALSHTAKHGQKASRIPHKLVMSTSIGTLVPHNGPISCLKWNTSVGSLLASGSLDGKIKIWDPLRSGLLVAEFSTSLGLRDLAWSNDSKSILFGGQDKNLVLMDVETGKKTLQVVQESAIHCVAFNPCSESSELLCGLSNGSIMAYDLRDDNMVSTSSNISYNSKSESGNFIMRIKLPGPVLSLEFLRQCSNKSDSNQYRLVTASEPADRSSLEFSISVWDWSSGIAITNGIYSEAYPCLYLKQHPTENAFAAQCSNDTAHAFSGSKFHKFRSFSNHNTSGYSPQLDFSPDGTYMYSGSKTGRLICYNWKSGKLLSWIPVFTLTDPCIAVNHHPVLNSVIACGSWSGNIAVYQ